MTKRVTIEALAQWLLERDDFVILGHVSPDGDAAGSCLGVWHALRALGKRAVVCLPEGVPTLYRSLPGANEVIPTGEPMPFAPKAALAVDVSEEPRLGEEGRRVFDACGERAVLDHHSTNGGFGQLMVLDGKAAAAGELAVPLVEAMGVKLSAEMGECLFVAISTDCGHFNFANTRPQTLEAAAKCVASGISVDAVTSWLYRTRTRSRTKLLGLVLAGLEVSADGRIAWARLTEQMLRDAGATQDENEGVIDYLNQIEGVQCAILASERGSQTKLSLRSKAPLNVAASVAGPLGGGGHVCAAGATVDLPLDEALEAAIALAQKALNQQ